MKAREHQARSAGRLAFHDKRPRRCNPHEQSSPLHAAWLDGWREACDAFTRDHGAGVLASMTGTDRAGRERREAIDLARLQAEPEPDDDP